MMNKRKKSDTVFGVGGKKERIERNCTFITSLMTHTLKGFTIVELIVAIALILFFATAGFFYMGRNDSLEGKVEKEKITTDIKYIKKQSLLEKRNIADIRFLSGEPGYSITYRSNESEGVNFSLELLGVVNHFDTESVSFTFNNIPAGYTLYVRDAQGNIRSFPTAYFSLSYDALQNNPFRFYLQGTNPTDVSNEIVYTFISRKNINKNQYDDMIVGITSTSCSTISFDAYGNMSPETCIITFKRTDDTGSSLDSLMIKLPYDI